MQVFCLHGGLSPSLDTLDNIRSLDRVQEVGTTLHCFHYEPDFLFLTLVYHATLTYGCLVLLYVAIILNCLVVPSHMGSGQVQLVGG